MRNKGISSRTQSSLVRRFVERSGADPEESSPEEAMAELIERARGRQIRNYDHQLQQVLRDRRVVSVEFVSDLGCDGMLEPIGPAFSDGFRMQLKKNASSERARFTMAHEVCHTFFYELVPEMKFKVHATDAAEEHLCNFGAAALLIPAPPLRKKIKRMAICLESLEQLARVYAVSLPTMLLRLRSLGLWKCQLSRWHRTASGDFLLDRLYGGRQAEWQWEDASLLRRVWESNAPVYGDSFVYIESSNGTRWFKPIAYNVQRSRDGAIALWGNGIKPRKPDHPLLDATRPARSTS